MNENTEAAVIVVVVRQLVAFTAIRFFMVMVKGAVAVMVG